MACARLSDVYAGLVEMVTSVWQASSSSLVSPLASLPATSATGPSFP